MKSVLPALFALVAVMLAFAQASAAEPATKPARPKVPLEFAAPSYTQEITVIFANERAARKAAVRIVPLWDGRDWAVSSRWDDNNDGNNAMRDCLAKHGHSGTFYLNGLYGDWSAGKPTLDSKYGRDLIAKGASIGCHSLTHPMLAYCSRSRMFEEVMGVRMQWEAAIDRPVMSYSFSYCSFWTPQEGLNVQADIARLLERAGYYNVASEPTFEDIDTELTLSPIMPSDGKDIDEYVKAATASDAFKAAHPNLTYSMHAWYTTPAAWETFEGQLEKYGHKADWWYCNQNQYGAYRYQYQRARLTVVKVAGNQMKLRLERPRMLDLGDETPLTLEVAGVKASEVAGVKCATAECKASDRKGELYHVSHDRQQLLPAKIGMVPLNHANRHEPVKDDYSDDFPDLRGLLHFEDGKLKLTLENKGDKPLRHVRLTYRLPLMWKEGVVRRDLPDIAGGKAAADSLTPTQVQKDQRYTMGRNFFAAQLDFVLDDRPGRLHLGCKTAPAEMTDRTYPCDSFLILGPVPNEQADPDALAKDIQDGKSVLADWVTGSKARFAWRTNDADKFPQQVDAEMIPLTCCFLPKPGWCVLAATVQSPKAQKLDILFYNGPTRAFLNGKEVKGLSTVELKQGANDLVIFTVEWGGFYLRFAQPGTQERAMDITYERPALPAAGKEAYTPSAKK